ncbi:MAG: HAD family phosphatase [Clostridia bacterium]|nr:HAD family phosphatase [Clostridia bacterium]MBR6300815.1 HAD family phosphatase [Clostridia bacterium]
MKAIIWDMDGTITDSEQFWTANPFRMLEHFGVPDPRGKNAPWFQTHYSESIKAYLESPDCKLNMTFEECIIWGKNYVYSHAYSEGTPMKPHARESLEAASALHIPMCLLSATEQQALKYTLFRNNMEHYFSFWLTTANRPLNKHHPELFQQVADRMGVALTDCLLIEDSLYSMKTGKAVGCKVWAIEDPKHVRDKEKIIALADRYFEDHVQLAKALREDFKVN